MYTLVLQDKVPQARELIQVSMSCNVLGLGLRLWRLNATFNNISVISWRSDLLMEKT